MIRLLFLLLATLFVFFGLVVNHVIGPGDRPEEKVYIFQELLATLYFLIAAVLLVGAFVCDAIISHRNRTGKKLDAIKQAISRLPVAPGIDQLEGENGAFATKKGKSVLGVPLW